MRSWAGNTVGRAADTVGKVAAAADKAAAVDTVVADWAAGSDYP